MSDTKLLAKDLRIGNLVYGPLNELCVVDQIGRYDNPEYVAYHELNNLVSGGQNGQRPIPLSEDVLVKNFGFRKLGKYTFIKKNLIIHRRKRGFVVNKKIRVIEYVHQLQNLYNIHSLTGEELIFTEN